MPDVLLVNQYFSFAKDSQEFVNAAFPLNLIYLASYLNERGVKTEILELGALTVDEVLHVSGRMRCGKDDEYIRRTVAAKTPKIVGIGCMFTRHLPEVLELAQTVRAALPEALIVVGGNHATVYPDTALHCKAIDVVVCGEGEETLLELSKTWLSGEKDLSAVRGIAYRDASGGTVRNESRPLIEDLDVLSLEFGLVDVRAYAALSKISPFLMRYPAIPITTSRGCPNDCIYCTVRSVYGRAWRGKSPKKTVDELEVLHKQYGIREFAILDDSASVNKVRWMGVCEEIISRNLDIRWTTPNGIAHWTLDKDIIGKMKEAGCYRLTFGIESGNVETRKYLRKPFPLAQAKEMLAEANRLGMWTICTNILGFPYEQKDSIEDTIRFACECGTDFATFYLLQPHLPSEVYKDFRKEGLLDFDDVFLDGGVNMEAFERMSKMTSDGGSPTKHFTAEELKSFQMEGYRRFILNRAARYLLRPWEVLRKVRSWEDFRYMLRLARIGVGILFRSFGRMTTKKLLYPELSDG